MLILPFLKLMAEKKASDIFFSANAVAQIKIEGKCIPVNDKPLAPDVIQKLAYSLLSSDEISLFEQEWEMNLGRYIEGLGNYRVNIFKQRGTVAMVIRYIAPKIPTLTSLNLPDTLQSLVKQKRGLIIVVGATGSGKSSTVAAMLEHRNTQLTGHILTVEDPIEFIHPHNRSIINQREIGADTRSYSNALKNAMREAPDVLMIGEIRDAETLIQSINYAQSGHLCLTTLHANNSYHMLNRVISFFPPDNRQALLMDLSVSLKAVISQRLVTTTGGKQIPALELLLNTSHIAELIRNGEIDRIKEAIDNSMSEGSQTFERALFDLYQSGQITLDEALKNADSPTNLYWLINHANEKSAPPAPAEQPNTTVRSDRSGSSSFEGFTLDL